MCEQVKDIIFIEDMFTSIQHNGTMFTFGINGTTHAQGSIYTYRCLNPESACGNIQNWLCKQQYIELFITAYRDDGYEENIDSFSIPIGCQCVY